MMSTFRIYLCLSNFQISNTVLLTVITSDICTHIKPPPQSRLWMYHLPSQNLFQKSTTHPEDLNIFCLFLGQNWIPWPPLTASMTDKVTTLISSRQEKKRIEHEGGMAHLTALELGEAEGAEQPSPSGHAAVVGTFFTISIWMLPANG